MESCGEMVVFPLLIESSYRACTIPYRFPSDDNPNKPTPIEISWINLFANSITSFKYYYYYYYSISLIIITKTHLLNHDQEESRNR